MKQVTMNEVYNKDGRELVVQYITRQFYHNYVSFNATKDKAVHVMLEAVGKIGIRLKPPSYHELRVPHLKNEFAYTKDLSKGHYKSIKK